MASASASAAATPAPSTNLVMPDLTMVRNNSVLEDKISMPDAPPYQTVQGLQCRNNAYMVMRHWTRFGTTAAHLEREALMLGEDVRRLMKSGNEMSAQELKDLRKLLRKTAKTAKSASHRNYPKSPPALPPPLLQTPSPPPMPASQQGEQAPPSEPP